MIGKGYLPVRIGTLVNARLYGGPYRQKPALMRGIKMAAEIPNACDVWVPTHDFSVPEENVLRVGLIRGIMMLHMEPNNVYVGCMGGIGRTGLYMAALAKVMAEYKKLMHRPTFDPVLYVRGKYIPHAVETRQQMEFIRDFDVSPIVGWCRMTQLLLDPENEVTKTKIVEDEPHLAYHRAVEVPIQPDSPFNPIDLQPLTDALTCLKDQCKAERKADIEAMMWDIERDKSRYGDPTQPPEPVKERATLWQRLLRWFHS